MCQPYKPTSDMFAFFPLHCFIRCPFVLYQQSAEGTMQKRSKRSDKNT